MSISRELHKQAENCKEQAQQAVEGPDKARYNRMADSWTSLANTQEWLDGELPGKFVGSGTNQPQESSGGE
jgi:hypothetical protein